MKNKKKGSGQLAFPKAAGFVRGRRGLTQAQINELSWNVRMLSDWVIKGQRLPISDLPAILKVSRQYVYRAVKDKTLRTEKYPGFGIWASIGDVLEWRGVKGGKR